MIKTIHQILLLDDYSIANDLRRKNKNMFNVLMPDFEYKLWKFEDIRKLMSEEFEYLNITFDSLIPYAYKSDLARLLILYKFGGWYVDMYVTPITRLEHNYDLMLFRDIQKPSLTSWSVSNGLIYAEPGLSIFKNSIEAIVENVKERYMGFSPLCPTGPSLLGREIAKDGLSKLNYSIGELVLLDQDGIKKGFLDQNGNKIADGKDMYYQTIFNQSFWDLWHQDQAYKK